MRLSIPSLLATVVLSHGTLALADINASTGADGALHVTANQSLVLPPDGVFNFTTITIDPVSTGFGNLSFVRNAGNTPVFLRATGDVIIDGTINVSAVLYTHPLGSQTGGPGGADGGIGGVGNTVIAGDGAGLAPGLIGGQYPNSSAGGGGGLATAGLKAIRHAGPLPGPGGNYYLTFPAILTGGSSGAGGSGNVFFGLQRPGGFGGGAGGAIRIDTPGNITINGAIRANGAWGQDVVPTGSPRPGGGGSGGIIDLHASGATTLNSSGLLEAKGGPGGGISTLQPSNPDFSSGADGGLGFIRIHGAFLNNNGTISGVRFEQPRVPAVSAPGLVVLAVLMLLAAISATYFRSARLGS